MPDPKTLFIFIFLACFIIFMSCLMAMMIATAYCYVKDLMEPETEYEKHLRHINEELDRYYGERH